MINKKWTLLYFVWDSSLLHQGEKSTKTSVPYLKMKGGESTDCVGFIPATPRGELDKDISTILEEEGRRIKMKLRSVEMGGVSLEKQLVRKNLKSGEPCGRPGCVLDLLSGGAGGPHNKPSVLYQGTCNLCGGSEETAEYWGETSRAGYHRTLKHQEEVVKRLEQCFCQTPGSLSS